MHLPTLFLVTASLGLLGIQVLLSTAILRARRARRELAEESHDRALALDRRCDSLQKQIDKLTAERNRADAAVLIDYLTALVTRARRKNIVSTAAADRLDDVVLSMRRAPADR